MKQTIKTTSYENSLRLLERKSQLHTKIEQLVYDGICESIKDATRQVNKAVYEMAEEQGVSIWDICFNYFPEYSHVVPKFKDFKIKGDEQSVTSVEGVIKLVPFVLELEKGPGYWKDKYLRLKEKMQNIIDEKVNGED